MHQRGSHLFVTPPYLGQFNIYSLTCRNGVQKSCWHCVYRDFVYCFSCINCNGYIYSHLWQSWSERTNSKKQVCLKLSIEIYVTSLKDKDLFSNYTIKHVIDFLGLSTQLNYSITNPKTLATRQVILVCETKAFQATFEINIKIVYQT